MAINKTQILQAAQSYMAKGQIEKAIEEWQKLISESPNDGNIYNTIGDLHLKKNDLNKAVDAYLKAADVFHTAGFALKTLAVYKKIIKLSPKRYDVYLKLGDVNAERGFTGNAIEDYLTVAKHYSQDSRIKDALEVYRKIANLDPTNTSIRLKLAEMCLKEGYEEQAVAEYLQAAKVLAESGQTQEAEAIYERVLKLDPKNEVARIGLGIEPSPEETIKQKDLLPRAEAAAEKGIYEQAEQLLRQLVTVDPANPVYHEKLGYLFLKKGQPFTAFTALKSAAQGYLQSGEVAQAAKLMQDYLAVDPNQIEAHQILALAHETQGDLHPAILEYARAIDEYLAMGDLAQAQPIYEKIKALNAEHRDVKRLRLLFEDRTIEPTSSLVSLEPILTQTTEEVSSKPMESKETPIDEVALKNLLTEAEVYIKYGLVNKAIDQLKQVLAMDPENIQAHTQLKETYRVEGRKSQAAAECLRLARIYKKRGETEAYDKAIEEARALDPDLATPQQTEPPLSSPEPMLVETEGSLADKVALEEELDRSFADFAVEEPPAVASAPKPLSESPSQEEPSMEGEDFVDLSEILHEEIKEASTPSEPVKAVSGPQDRDQALRSVITLFHDKEAEAQDKDVDYETHYNLGIAYSEMGLIAEAIAEFKLSARGPERFIDSCNMLAACFQQKGMIQEAIQALEEALVSPQCGDPEWRWLSYDLASLYERNGQLEAAFKLYTHIYDRDRNFKDVAKRLEALRKALGKPAGGKAGQKPEGEDKDIESMMEQITGKSSPGAEDSAPGRKDQDKKKSRISYL